MLHYNSFSLFHVLISVSHTRPNSLCPLLSHRLSPWLTFLYVVLPLSLSPTCPLAVALYAISAVYFAGVMVRLMLTLTPVVCMLSAVAFSSVFEHYMGDDTKREKPPAEDSSDEDDKRNSGNLYDKVRTGENDPNVHETHKGNRELLIDFTPLDVLFSCLSAFLTPQQFSLPVWVTCDPTVIQLQLLDAVAIIVAVSLCRMLFPRLSLAEPNCGFVYSGPPWHHITSCITHRYPSLRRKLCWASAYGDRLFHIIAALYRWRNAVMDILAMLGSFDVNTSCITTNMEYTLNHLLPT